jgi:hypothetical protein
VGKAEPHFSLAIAGLHDTNKLGIATYENIQPPRYFLSRCIRHHRRVHRLDTLDSLWEMNRWTLKKQPHSKLF